MTETGEFSDVFIFCLSIAGGVTIPLYATSYAELVRLSMIGAIFFMIIGIAITFLYHYITDSKKERIDDPQDP